jgi:hypothetical protein
MLPHLGVAFYLEASRNSIAGITVAASVGWFLESEAVVNFAVGRRATARKRTSGCMVLVNGPDFIVRRILNWGRLYLRR